MFKVFVHVTPKRGVADPQGAAVERALPALGHYGVHNIRVGRYITLEVEGDDPNKVRAEVDDMCRRLLANPIIEDYFFEIALLDEGSVSDGSSSERSDQETREQTDEGGGQR